MLRGAEDKVSGGDAAQFKRRDKLGLCTIRLMTNWLAPCGLVVGTIVASHGSNPTYDIFFCFYHPYLNPSFLHLPSLI